MKELIEQFQLFILSLSEDKQASYKELLQQLIMQLHKDDLIPKMKEEDLH